MGIKIAGWQEDLINQFKESGYQLEAIQAEGLTTVNLAPYGKLLLHLISSQQGLQPQDILSLQANCRIANLQLIQIWEDIWLNSPGQVLSRICSLLGANKKLHGRKTLISTISQSEADLFLNQFHLQGTAKSRYRSGLVLDGELVAVATFSARRKMIRKPGDYYSVELIRFASRAGITVQGGLSKLIKHLTSMIAVNDVMSYADLDWSQGKGYLSLGFELAESSGPSLIWLNTITMQRFFPHRLPAAVLAACPAAGELTFPPSSSLTVENENSGARAIFTDTLQQMQLLDHVPVFNTGNHKYILPLPNH